jgi:hypothetical protein
MVWDAVLRRLEVGRRLWGDVLKVRGSGVAGKHDAASVPRAPILEVDAMPALEPVTSSDLVERSAQSLEVAAEMLRRIRAERDTARRDADRLREHLRDAGFPET